MSSCRRYELPIVTTVRHELNRRTKKCTGATGRVFIEAESFGRRPVISTVPPNHSNSAVNPWIALRRSLMR